MSSPSVPAPPWRAASRKQAKARRALSREAIVEAALHVIDTEGLDALSMRRVAQELGTGAASLYAHVASKEQLVEEVLDQVYAEIAALAPREDIDADNWQEHLRDWMRRGRDVFAAHRDIARAAMAQGMPTGPNALVNIESMLAMLRAGGLPDQVVAYAVATLSNYLTAAVFEESLHESGRAEAGIEPGEYSGQLSAYLASLPSDRFPNIVAMVEPMTRDEGDERFEFGMDLLIAGLAQHTPGGSSSPR